MVQSRLPLAGRWIVVLGLALVSGGAHGAQSPERLDSRITSVGLFKNGVAVVRREVKLPGPGAYLIDEVPEPVHGTFWIESTTKVEARVIVREVTRPVDGSASARLQSDLVGQTVQIVLREAQMPTVDGVVIDTAPGPARFSRDFESPEARPWWSPHPGSTSEQPARFLIVQTRAGLTYVDTSLIALLTVNPSTTVKRRVPVLELTVAAPVPAGGAVATISYLAKGMAWAPAYEVDLGQDGKLSIRQQAVVRNELEALDGAEVSLITGFPSIEFAHVTSPLASDVTWASFFRELNRRPGAGADVTSNAIVQQQAVAYGREAADEGLSLPQIDDGVDVSYRSIGPRRIALGESLMIEVAAGSASYESLVEWVVPDTRDPDGRLLDDWHRQQNPAALDDSPWDAVRFKNPFDFPLTTAPAMITKGGRFVGQRTLTWVAPGEATTLRINKALSIRTHATELEQPDERQVINYGGRAYRRVLVKGELLVSNYRKQSVALAIRRQFSGELVSADADPQKALREVGVYSVNPRYELTWKLDLAAGEQRTLTYSYNVLVAH